MTGIQIVSTGRGVPGRVVTNDDLSKIVETNDEWISSKTGIKQRYFCENETNVDLALEAARKAIEGAGIDKSEIGVFIVATFTPDYACPSMSCILHEQLGLRTDIPSFDLGAACAGFVYSLRIASSLLENATAPYALIIGSEQISTRLDMTDRNTCVLFGDGAGAAIVRLKPGTQLHSVWGSEGMKDVLGCTGQNMGKPYIFMDGQRVFKNAVKRMGDAAREVLEMSEMTIDDIDYVVCHQANERIIDSVCKKLGVPEEKIFKNISKYGNTSAATIPIALDEMNEAGMLKKGQKILLATFGAGFTWASMIIET